MNAKPKMTRHAMLIRINSEAPEMKKDIENQGGRLSLAECKKELEKVFREEFEIV